MYEGGHCCRDYIKYFHLVHFFISSLTKYNVYFDFSIYRCEKGIGRFFENKRFVYEALSYFRFFN